MTNDRTETARDHDDSAMIDRIEKTPQEQGRAGGNLARDVGTDAAMQRVRDPEAQEGVDKQDEINHGERTPG
ncbi:hypothetical protein ABS767_14040 [Sphingomonas sp. ST-64]|uniref:Uncharacterized protein n=1 Tax=Sphingomonas plantiphila TaxID=3163295 RepID=A0ABW8YSP5_9SPHN